MIANLWMLNAPNGMFWYAADYILGIQRPTTVLVRPHLMDVAHAALSGAQVRVVTCSLPGLIARVANAARQCELVFCPTSHPMPWVHNQVVVFHDSYPFEGAVGRRKLAAFSWGVRTSRCRVAYINRSMALPFLQGLRIPQQQLLFAPNLPPKAPVEKASAAVLPRGQPMILGAFGTDSDKKRYSELLEALDQPRFRGFVQLRIYGEANDYTARLRLAHPGVPFVLVRPSEMPLTTFIRSLDGAISIAVAEGFGRPLASAVVAGLPCYPADSMTLREFFGAHAILSNDLTQLLDAAIRRDRPPNTSDKGAGSFLAPTYAKAVEDAISTLRQADCVDK
jgi:hypothetical protein